MPATMNRRQFLAASVLAAPALAALCSCTRAEDAPFTSAELGEGFTFKQGYDRDFPPYSYIGDDGKDTGFDIELCDAVCRHNGWVHELVPIDWDTKNAELYAGGCDCIWSGFTKFKDNEHGYLWSEPYSNNSQMVMVKKNSPIKTLADLAGKRVGVQRGTSTHEMFLEKSEDGKADLAATFAELRVYDNFNAACADLGAGGIDAIGIDVTFGNYLIGSDPTLTYLDEVLSEEVYAIGFRLGDEALLAKVWEAVLALVEDGTFDAIGKKYPDLYDSLLLGR